MNDTFNVGDTVRVKSSGKIGRIVLCEGITLKSSENYTIYLVQFPSGMSFRFMSAYLERVEAEPPADTSALIAEIEALKAALAQQREWRAASVENECALAGYRAYVHSCIRSGETPHYFEQYVARVNGNREHELMPDSSPSIISQLHRERDRLKRDADTLRRLWQSTESLFRRFGVYPPGKSEQARVLFEEVYELTEAALWVRCVLGDSEPLREGDLEELRAAVAEEAADVIVTALGVCMANGVSLEAIEAAVELVAAKNDAKQPDVTHEVNAAGKIARKGPVK